MIIIFKLDSTFYRALTWFYHITLLNILFLFCCLPIITIFPAVAALFGVVRDWRNGKDDAVFRPFKEKFIENLKQSYLAGILLSLIGVFLWADWFIIGQIGPPLKFILSSAIGLITVLYAIASLTIFPVMVHMDLPFKQICVNSLKIGLYKIHLSIFTILVLVVWTIVSVSLSFLFFICFFSVAAYIVYWINDLKFSRLIEEHSC